MSGPMRSVLDPHSPVMLGMYREWARRDLTAGIVDEAYNAAARLIAMDVAAGLVPSREGVYMFRVLGRLLAVRAAAATQRQAVDA